MKIDTKFKRVNTIMLRSEALLDTTHFSHTGAINNGDITLLHNKQPFEATELEAEVRIDFKGFIAYCPKPVELDFLLDLGFTLRKVNAPFVCSGPELFTFKRTKK